ncbi:MAG: FAD-dependent oxidoreductase, partial [Burkholderiaceae bacterium]|nr:FAD-dependent oxidoreductase [Burkholderiaceae bacterium]
MSQHAIVVPDIGDYSDVPVIEVLVKVGDAIEKEQPLIVLESDKATMEVPADQAGIVTSLTIKVGDKVSKGSVIGQLEVSAAASASTPAVASSPAITKSPTPPPVAPAAIPVPAGAYQGKVQHECEVLVLGAGPGGYSAAFRSADLGANVILVERYPTLGGVCLNVGCIPSKALLHTAAVMDEVKHMAKHGIEFAPPKINLDQLRQHKEGVIAKLTGGLAGMAKMRKVNVVRGLGRFLDAHHLEVNLCTGSGQDLSGQKEVIRFQKAIIAAGSQPIALPFMPKDPRVVDSTGALLLQSIPKRMLVIGGGPGGYVAAIRAARLHFAPPALHSVANRWAGRSAAGTVMPPELESPAMQLIPVIAIHMTAALAALAIGPVALWARKGRVQRTHLHRAAGYAWVTLMLATA